MKTGACGLGVLLGISLFAASPAVGDDRTAASAVKAPAVKPAPAAGSDFSVALSPGSVSLSPGGHATLTVSTRATSGAPGSIALAVLSLPAGVTGSLSPASVAAGGSATLTLTASGSPAAGVFTVTGVSGAAKHAAQGAIAVAAAPKNDFALSLSPAGVSLPPGGHATLTVSTHVTSGSPASIAFTLSGLPAGVSGSFSPASVAAGAGTTLTLAASASAAPGAQTFTVTGVSSGATHALQGGVAIVAAPKSEFSIALSPASAALSPGAQATFTVSTAVVSGTQMSIVLSISGLPPGVTGAFSPATVPSGGSATLTLAAAASAASASKTFVVTGTGGTASHTAKATIAVQSGRLRVMSLPR